MASRKRRPQAEFSDEALDALIGDTKTPEELEALFRCMKKGVGRTQSGRGASGTFTVRRRKPRPSRHSASSRPGRGVPGIRRSRPPRSGNALGCTGPRRSRTSHSYSASASPPRRNTVAHHLTHKNPYTPRPRGHARACPSVAHSAHVGNRVVWHSRWSALALVGTRASRHLRCSAPALFGACAVRPSSGLPN